MMMHDEFIHRNNHRSEQKKNNKKKWSCRHILLTLLQTVFETEIGVRTVVAWTTTTPLNAPFFRYTMRAFYSNTRRREREISGRMGEKGATKKYIK